MSTNVYRVIQQPKYADSATLYARDNWPLIDHLGSLDGSYYEVGTLEVERDKLQEFVNARDFDISDSEYAALQRDIDATAGDTHIEYAIF